MKPLLQSFSGKTEDGLLKQHTARFDNELGHDRFAVVETAHLNVQRAKYNTSAKTENDSSFEQPIRIVDANNYPDNPESKTQTWVEFEKPRANSADHDEALAQARARVAEVQSMQQSDFDLAA